MHTPGSINKNLKINGMSVGPVLNKVKFKISYVLYFYPYGIHFLNWNNVCLLRLLLKKIKKILDLELLTDVIRYT